MTTITDHLDYWDHYAEARAVPPRETALTNAFGWTQYNDHGPGIELLRSPRCALELGSGAGAAVAVLALQGIEATGVDVSATQVETAQRHWGDVSGAHYVQAGVTEFLDSTDQRWDAIYSIWGALWFTNPDAWLPLVRKRLSPGGTLVFSQAPAVPGSYGVQGMYGNGFTGRQVWIYRWAYEPDMWVDLLHEHDFTDVRARVEPAPEPSHVGTLIVEAHG